MLPPDPPDPPPDHEAEESTSPAARRDPRPEGREGALGPAPGASSPEKIAEGDGSEEAKGPDGGGGGPFGGEPSRLSPTAVVVWTLEGVYALILAVIAGGAQPTLGAAILGFVLAANVTRYLRFRWRLEPDALIIEQGLIRRHRRVIPRDRIHTVDLERKVRHRTFGVVEVRVETMGGGETEGSLAALDPATAEELRRRLLTGADRPGRVEVEADADPDAHLEELARVPAGRLVMAGLTGGRVGIGAAVVAAALQFAPEEWVERVILMGAEEGPEFVAAGGIRLVLLLVLVALFFGFLLSLVATVFTYWDFTLARDETTLRVRRGLLTLRRDTVPFGRIQAVRVEENIVRRLLGLAAVRVTVAGRAGEEVEETGLVLPIGRRGQAFRLARLVAHHPGEGAPALEPMPRGARDRRRVRAVVAALLAGGGAFLATATTDLEAGMGGGAAAEPFGGPLLPAGVATVLVGLLSLWMARTGYRNLGCSDFGSHVVVSEGVTNRRTTFVEVNRLQTLETTATPFQRRRGLATLVLGIPRAMGAGRTPRALDLREEEAGRLREALVARVRHGSGSPS